MRLLVIMIVIIAQSVPTFQQCRKYDFNCGQDVCISMDKVCDGNPDCQGNADENVKICSTLRCPPVSFRCDYGACINFHDKCNGVTNCADGSDEKNCSDQTSNVQPTDSLTRTSCKSFEFQCHSGQCIDNDLVCDATIDCSDKSDEIEETCGNITCGEFGFRCKYGACIERKKRCDGKAHCPDSSDESALECKRSPTTKSGCEVPAKPVGGDYVQDCSSRCKPPTNGLYPIHSKLLYKCQPGYASITNDQVCLSIGWYPQLDLPPCYKKCPTPSSRSVVYTCGRSECQGLHQPGTTATVKCRNYYLKPKNYSEEQSKLICLADGNWDKIPFKCQPKCGEPASSTVMPLISYGMRTKAEEHPWQAAIYRKETVQWEYICGGTIISPKFILSAAHCYGSAVDILVAVGKYYRDLEKSEPQEQRIPVKEIFNHPHYVGQPQNFAHDIALLLLESEIGFSALVMPACIDWKRDLKIKKNELATLAGWGLDENRKVSEQLMVAKIPYMSQKDCQGELSKDISLQAFQKYLTVGKFCLFYQNGTGAQQGDSGGGSTFMNPKDKLHYVTGVVSAKPSDQITGGVDKVSLFTAVEEYLSWIKDLVQKYDKELQ